MFDTCLVLFWYFLVLVWYFPLHVIISKSWYIRAVKSVDIISEKDIMSATPISKLRYNEILHIAEILDYNLSSKNWNSLGKLIIEEKTDIKSHQVDFLKHGYVEEESASWEFVHNLSAKVPSCSISTFKKIARTLKRIDICNFLDKMQDKSLDIWKLPIQEKKQLLYYLELPCVTSSDWRMFADELGYSYAEISRISRRNRSLERPTVLLFNLIISKYPTSSLQELKEICMKAP